MKRRYFQLYNLVDWMVYLIAMLFVFDFCIDYDFGWVGCKGPKVRSKTFEYKRKMTSHLYSAGNGLWDPSW